MGGDGGVTLSIEVLKAQKGRGDFQVNGGIKWGDHLPPNKYIKNSCACETAPTEHLLDAGRGSQTSKKANQSPQNEVGEKIKTKRETRDIRLGTCTPRE